MSKVMKTIYTAIIGAWSALIGWSLLDVVFHFEMKNLILYDVLVGLVIGVCIGASIRISDNLFGLRQRGIIKSLLIGSILGSIAGIIGLLMGEFFFKAIGASIISRAIGWMVFGTGVGVSLGVLSLSKVDVKRILYGSIGGALGGLIGGCVFQLLTRAPDFPRTTRAISLVIVGASIGLFIGLVQMIMAQALVKIVRGRPEGREEIITKPVTLLGRSEISDIGLFGDMSIEKEHATIRRVKNDYILYNTSQGSELYVNREKIQEHKLNDGDLIGIGEMLLLFRLRKSREGG